MGDYSLDRVRFPRLITEPEREDLEARPFQFFEYVPEEFTRAAVQMHIARWGAEPAEHAFGVQEFKALGLVK